MDNSLPMCKDDSERKPPSSGYTSITLMRFKLQRTPRNRKLYSLYRGQNWFSVPGPPKCPNLAPVWTGGRVRIVRCQGFMQLFFRKCFER